MPRGKRKKGTKARDRDREISEFWCRMINGGLEARREYTERAKEVETYLGPNHDELYDSPAIKGKFMNFDGSCAVTVPKIAQMRNTLGPRLYQAKPVRTVTPTTDDGVMLGLARVQEAYLRYTTREAKFAKQLRKSLDDAIIRGRGFLLQEIDPVRDITTSVYVPSMDVVFDPDFHDIEDAKWIAIRRTEPLWETKRRVPEKWRWKNLAPSKRSGAKEGDQSDKHRKSTSADLVTYWVVLSKMGKGFRGTDMNKRRDDSQDFVRLEIVLDHEVPLAEGSWDVPLYLDKDWPLCYVDFVEPLDKHWPDSMASQVLGSQKAIDLISSLRMSSCKNRDRLIAFVDTDYIDKDMHHTLRCGSSADLIPIKAGNRALNEILFIPDFGEGSREALLERQFHIQQIEATTGVTDVLHGGQEPDAKERSATASQLRSDAANARIADLRHRVEEFTTDAARKEAIITRLTLDAEDIEPVVRTGDIGLFYVRVDVPGGVPLPVRDTRSQSERKREEGPLTLEDLSPQASTFFLSPEEAFESATRLWEEMQATKDPRVIALVQEILPMGVDEMSGLPLAISTDVVTVELVWEATAGLSPSELMREFSYEIATGSGNKLNKEAEQVNADYLTQTAMPAALQMGDLSAANKIMQVRDEAYEVPEDKRIQFAPPPPPTVDQAA